MTDNPLLEYALYYAGRGWPVIPCWPPKGDVCRCGKETCVETGKAPLGKLVPNGLQNATTDEATILRWWDAHPDAGVGIVQGGGRMVVDFDFYHGGDVTLDVLEEKYGKLPASLRAASGRGDGSFHLYLTYPAGVTIRSAKDKLGPGVDVKAEGGYVVAPPSPHRSGSKYVWLDEDDSTIEAAPAWLVELLSTSQTKTYEDAENRWLNGPDSMAVARYWFDKAKARAAAGASRHDTWIWFTQQCASNMVEPLVCESHCDEWERFCISTGRGDSDSRAELRRSLYGWGYKKEHRLAPLDDAVDLMVAEEEAATGVAAPVPLLKPPPPKVVTAPASDWYTPAQALLKGREFGRRFKTGIPIIDSLTRGGILMGKMPVFVGRPGSGKTGLAIQCALGMQADSGDAHVGFLMADEGLAAAVIRMAQRFGFNRDKLEMSDPDTIRDAAAELAKLERVYFMDPHRPTSTLEAFLAGMNERAGGEPQILVIDSVQVVQCANARDKDRRISTAMAAEAINAHARSTGAIPITLSQSNRASYRSGKRAENSDPLSAGAESGSIEHQTDIQINLEPVGDDGRVRVVVPKSRLGRTRQNPFWLEWDFDRATFTEVDELEMSREMEAEKMERATSKVWIGANKVLAQLKKSPLGLTTRTLGAKAGLGGTKLHEALAMLEEKGMVHSSDNPGRGGGLLWKFGVEEGTED